MIIHVLQFHCLTPSRKLPISTRNQTAPPHILTAIVRNHHTLNSNAYPVSPIRIEDLLHPRSSTPPQNLLNTQTMNQASEPSHAVAPNFVQMADLYPSAEGTTGQLSSGPRPVAVTHFVGLANQQHEAEQQSKAAAMRSLLAKLKVAELQDMLQQRGIRLSEEFAARYNIARAEAKRQLDLEAAAKPLTTREQYILDVLIDWRKYYENATEEEIEQAVAEQQEKDWMVMEVRAQVYSC